MTSHETTVRVRYAETDQMGVVYHANYLIWMEVGRVEFCRARGIRYRDLETEDGILLAVAEATCRYSFPARYDDEVTIRTSIEKSNPRMVHFRYEMTCDGRKLATGATTHVFLSKDLRPVKLPRKHWGLFGIEER